MDHFNAFTGCARLDSSNLVNRAAKMWEILTPSKIDAIARTYREAIELDANNAQAFAGLALALITTAMMNGIHAPNLMMPRRLRSPEPSESIRKL